jgi:hypothetical protein
MKSKLTVTLVCDKLRERVCEWRRDVRKREIGFTVVKRKGVFAALRDRANGARFVEVFPEFAGQEIVFAYGDDLTLPAPVAEWLFANGYLEPRDRPALWA